MLIHSGLTHIWYIESSFISVLHKDQPILFDSKESKGFKKSEEGLSIFNIFSFLILREGGITFSPFFFFFFHMRKTKIWKNTQET